MKTMKVAHGIQRRDTDLIKDYKVISVKNSVDYAPGQILTKDLVAGLCEDAAWDVVILPLEAGR